MSFKHLQDWSVNQKLFYMYGFKFYKYYCLLIFRSLCLFISAVFWSTNQKLYVYQIHNLLDTCIYTSVFVCVLHFKDQHQEPSLSKIHSWIFFYGESWKMFCFTRGKSTSRSFYVIHTWKGAINAFSSVWQEVNLSFSDELQDKDFCLEITAGIEITARMLLLASSS